MSELRGVLFDFNGVLVDDEHLHLRGFNEALAPLGVRVSDADYEARYLGFDDRGAFEAMLRDAGLAHDAPRVAALIEAKRVIYARMAEAELKVFPGAAEALRMAAALAPLAIVSGALRSEIALALRVIGVGGDVVRAIVAADDVSACKPDPEGYLLGLARLGVGPRGCVAVEDSLAGVESARAAGLAVIGVAHTYPAERLSEAGATRVIARLSELSAGALHAAALAGFSR